MQVQRGDRKEEEFRRDKAGHRKISSPYSAWKSTYELFISVCSPPPHLIFLDHSWWRVTETLERETAMRELCTYTGSTWAPANELFPHLSFISIQSPSVPDAMPSSSILNNILSFPRTPCYHSQEGFSNCQIQQAAPVLCLHGQLII